jgi:hypothetical protein
MAHAHLNQSILSPLLIPPEPTSDSGLGRRHNTIRKPASLIGILGPTAPKEDRKMFKMKRLFLLITNA